MTHYALTQNFGEISCIRADVRYFRGILLSGSEEHRGVDSFVVTGLRIAAGIQDFHERVDE